MYIGLIPAYRRDYKSKAAVTKDLLDGKDFRIADISNPADGAYTSIRDFKAGDVLRIRYNQLERILIHKVT